MSIYKTLCLLHRFELIHTSLSHSCRLGRQLGSVVGVLGCIVNRFWYQFSMGDAIAAQLVGYDLPGLALVLAQQRLKETFYGFSITPPLQEYINNLTTLVHSTPQIMLLASNLHEHLINEERIAVSLMLSSQASGIFRSKLVAPQSNRFMADRDISLSQQIFYVSMTEVESVIKPNHILNYFRGKSVTFVHICFNHGMNHRRMGFNLAVPLF
ncbi:MAG: hypothetical protein ACJAS2_001173 [Pseudohongiellaceae bacterium]|jgi:hypothetical protein